MLWIVSFRRASSRTVTVCARRCGSRATRSSTKTSTSRARRLLKEADQLAAALCSLAEFQVRARHPVRHVCIFYFSPLDCFTERSQFIREYSLKTYTNLKLNNSNFIKLMYSKILSSWSNLQYTSSLSNFTLWLQRHWDSGACQAMGQAFHAASRLRTGHRRRVEVRRRVQVDSRAPRVWARVTHGRQWSTRTPSRWVGRAVARVWAPALEQAEADLRRRVRQQAALVDSSTSECDKFGLNYRYSTKLSIYVRRYD